MGAVRSIELGVAAGVAMARTTLRLVAGTDRSPERDPWAEVPDEPRGERLTVVADDGVALHAEIEGDPTAPVTIVLCHGFAVNSESWCLQRAYLGRRARVVVWDQRGHGRSERGPSAHATIDQIGRDLYAVLTQAVPAGTGGTNTVPAGPVVLAGHSMGGMAIMSLAEQYPELFGDRVSGVALLGTSAGPVVGDFGLPSRGMNLLHWAAPHALAVFRGITMVAGGRRRAAREFAQLLVPRHAFASEVPPALAEFLLDLIESTPLDVIADFFPQFRVHDRRAALAVLSHAECLILAGDQDVVTPRANSETIARAVPGAELVVVPNAGHMFMLEHPRLVNAHLARLLACFDQRRSA